MLAIILFAVITLLPGSGNYRTDGNNVWIGPEGCADGFLLSPDSPAIDAGVWIEGFHCPLPGMNPSGCAEWENGNPDAGACEWVGLNPNLLLLSPTDLIVI